MSNNYYNSKKYKLNGKWSLEKRLIGLSEILEIVEDKIVIDLGCAEGLITKELLDRGARYIYAFDCNKERIEKAIDICKEYKNVEFIIGDFNNFEEFINDNNDILKQHFDIVLYLGVHHHLEKKVKSKMMELVLNLGDNIAMRINGKLKLLTKD